MNSCRTMISSPAFMSYRMPPVSLLVPPYAYPWSINHLKIPLLGIIEAASRSRISVPFQFDIGTGVATFHTWPWGSIVPWMTSYAAAADAGAAAKPIVRSVAQSTTNRVQSLLIMSTPPFCQNNTLSKILSQTPELVATAETLLLLIDNSIAGG